VLSVQGLTKRFGGFTAVAKVSFELEEGEILGLIGPNGSGKTTLINCISGSLRNEAGSIHFLPRASRRKANGWSPARCSRRAGSLRMAGAQRSARALPQALGTPPPVGSAAGGAGGVGWCTARLLAGRDDGETTGTQRCVRGADAGGELGDGLVAARG
jgi:energy-coupling factor transporter ATP-binding protein EcfA2